MAACGDDHSLAVTADGGLWTWGAGGTQFTCFYLQILTLYGGTVLTLYLQILTL
jgi:alpha-tubulin suppressor-like RCC1 family protein